MSRQPRKTPPEPAKRQEIQLQGIKEIQLAWILGAIALFTSLILDPVGAEWVLGIILELNSRSGSWVAWIPMGLFLGILASLGWGTRVLMSRLRNHAGFSSQAKLRPRPWALPRFVSWIAGTLAGGGVLLSMIASARFGVPIFSALKATWVAAAWALGIALIGAGSTSGQTRLVGVGVFGILLSIPYLILEGSFGSTTGLLFGAWALVLGVSGVFALRRSITGDPNSPQT